MRSEFRRVCSAVATAAFAAGLSAQPVFGDEGNGLLRRIFGGQKPNAANAQTRRPAPSAAPSMIRPTPNPGQQSNPAARPAPGVAPPAANYNNASAPTPLPRFSPVPNSPSYPVQPGVLVNPSSRTNASYGGNSVSTYPSPPLAPVNPNFGSRSAATATAPAPSMTSTPAATASTTDADETTDAETSALPASSGFAGGTTTAPAPAYESTPSFAASTPAVTTPSPANRPLAPQTKPLTSSDPLLTRTATAKTNGGQSFGMFLQIYYDGSILDSTGLHRLSREDLNALLNAIQAAEPAKRVGSHCGSASNDFLDQVQYVVYNRNPYNNQLRAYNFTCTGNTDSCDAALQKLHQVVEQIQSKINSPELMAPGAASAPMTTPTAGVPVGVNSLDGQLPTFPPPPDYASNPNANNVLTGNGLNTSADALPAGAIASSPGGMPLPLPSGTTAPSSGSGLNFRSNGNGVGNGNSNSMMPPPPSVNVNVNAPKGDSNANADTGLSITPANGSAALPKPAASNPSPTPSPSAAANANANASEAMLPMLAPPAINPEVKR